MKKRYLPFGYVVRDGNIVVDTEQGTIVQNIFTAYLAGNTFQQIATSMISKGIEYHQDDAEWNKNTISRILGNDIYCGTDRYPPIVTKEIFRQAAQVRSAKASAYSAALAPFRKDIQCGCCGERLYWHGKTNQWHCRQCRMWSAPIEEAALSEEITQRLNGYRKIAFRFEHLIPTLLLDPWILLALTEKFNEKSQQISLTKMTL